MNLKRGALAAWLVGSAVLMLTGCAQGSDAASGAEDAAEVNTDAPLYAKLPDRIKDAGKIVNAGDLTYAPFEWLQEDGKTVKGIDVDIASALSEQIGVPFDWQDVKTEAALSGIQSKRYDALLASMTYTDERAEVYDYVTYLKAASGFITSPDRVGEFTSLDDLCGKKVAGTRGTIQVTQVEELSADCVANGDQAINIQMLDSDQAGILQIRQGGVDASVILGAVGSYAVSQAEGAVELIPGLTVGDSVYGIMLNKADAELRDVLLEAMNAIIADGSYEKILEEWGVSDLALDESLINNAR
ncbi:MULTISPECIES: ABC transporter substrate-binding protein [Leucobacter]|uniref:ABC transporter substrate-binding protein n=1 Tax=Leucobacter TaxID=55968 RepID=UPI00210421A9|nr:ABC transporter substrate-binding protein [Leucobacter aridicollis]UTX52195.1 ABC transporter substrate-binding protein [Leucobacter aridicollis]